MPLKDHLDNTLRINPAPTPLFKMMLSALAITTPLVVGYFTHNLFVSMFGSLMGLVFYLNDPFGPLYARGKHLIAAFFILMLALVAGVLCVENNYLIVLILFILGFLVGKSKTFGIDLERLMVFITLEFLTASSDQIFKLHLKDLILYSSVSFFIYLFWAMIIFKITNHETATMVSKRETLKKIIVHNKSSYFPLVCATFSCLAYVTAKMLEFSHANWVVATAIIVMLPDSYQSIYKSTQRFLGTTAGVIIATIVLMYVHDIRFLIAFVFLVAFLIPHGFSKNYWIANVYIAAMILFFLEISAPQSIVTHHLAYWRIVDIALGSLIGMLAAFFTNPTIPKKLIKKLRF